MLYMKRFEKSYPVKLNDDISIQEKFNIFNEIVTEVKNEILELIGYDLNKQIIKFSCVRDRFSWRMENEDRESMYFSITPLINNNIVVRVLSCKYDIYLVNKFILALTENKNKTLIDEEVLRDVKENPREFFKKWEKLFI